MYHVLLLKTATKYIIHKMYNFFTVKNRHKIYYSFTIKNCQIYMKYILNFLKFQKLLCQEIHWWKTLVH